MEDLPTGVAPAVQPWRARPLREAWRLLRPVLSIALLLAALAGSLAGGASWLVRTEPGAVWLLGHVPHVQLAGWRGALLGDAVGADRLRVEWDGGKQSVTIEGVSAAGLRWHWRPHPGVWVGLDAASLVARRVEVQTGPPSGAPLTLPASLSLPAQLDVADAHVGELQIDTLAPLRQLAGHVQLGADGGREHRVEGLSLQWDRVQAGGQARLASAAPFALTAHLRAQSLPPAATAASAAASGAGAAPGTPAGAASAAAPAAARSQASKIAGATGVGARAAAGQATGTAPTVAAGPSTWSADARIEGNLARFGLIAQLGGEIAPGRPAPALDLKAQVTPFATWPLAALSLATQNLDLAALASGAPQTRLSGRAEIQSSAADAPVGVAIALDNAAPGRWDEKRLPLRRIELRLRASAGQRDRLELPAFDLQLGNARNAAGRWSGSGMWQGTSLTLDTRLSALRPQQLDARAAAMTLAGPLSLVVGGLPSPDPSADAKVDAKAPGLSLQWNTELEGSLDVAPQPVRLTLAGSADARQVTIARLIASAGSASAEATASARRLPSGDWQVLTAGALNRFDPLPWWPGGEGSAWHKGPHRLSAEWRAGLRVPAQAGSLPLLALLPRLAGDGTLKLHDSLLAGVPLNGQVDLSNGKPDSGTGSGTGADAPTTLAGALNLGGNTLVVSGHGNPTGAGEHDRLQLELKADAIGALAPLARLDPALAAWTPKAGQIEASLTADGRWPKLRTDGHLLARGLELGPLKLAHGIATWQLDSGTDQPLNLKAELTSVALGHQRLEQLQAELLGTLRHHRLQLTAAVPQGPSALADQLLALRSQAGTRALLQGEGNWEPTAGGGGTWRGSVPLLAVGVWDGKPLTAAARAASAAASGAAATAVASATKPAATAAPDASWIDARDLAAELVFDAEGRLKRAQASPGRVQLVGGVQLRWDAIRIDNSGAEPNIDLRATVEPFAVAPLLARAQPGLGWGGDLRVGALIDIRAGERFDADIVAQRGSGDLWIKDENGTLPLAISDLKLALTAHNGQWLLTQALAGRELGTMSAQLSTHTTPQRRWPGADAPLSGSVEAHVNNLGTWGSWVPPGWRLSGALQTEAQIGGRFGAPEYSGQIAGRQIGARNLLQGVNFTDGDVAISLKGNGAQIERFTLKGGDGTLRIEGGAEFGEKPSAQVRLVAERFQVLGRIDRKLKISGSADLGLAAERIKLDGNLKIDEGLFETTRGEAPTLDEDVNVLRPAADTAEAAPDAPPRARRALDVAVDIDLGEKLQVKARGLDTFLRGKLRITTPGGRMAVNGSVRTEGGTFVGYGQKMDIDRGVVVFSGPAENPRLDILALRQNLDVQVGVAITGSALSPRIRLYSDPDMTDADKLSWLVLGRASDGLGRNDTALLQSAALALLNGEGEGRTDALLRNIGLDSLSVRQQTDGDVRETVVSLGKQLSRRWYVGFERGVNSTTGTWQLIYRIAQQFTLRAQSGADNSLDVIWVWRFD